MTQDAHALAARLIRNLHDAPTRRFVREPLYESQAAPLAEGTAAQKMGAKVVVLAPGKRGCPYHLHHAQEEMFVVIEGEGTLRVAGEMLALRTGDVAFIPAGPAYPHQILNTSDKPLKYLAISTMESPEICEYPDSGKYLAESFSGGAPQFETVQAKGGGVDYWQGEP